MKSVAIVLLVGIFLILPASAHRNNHDKYGAIAYDEATGRWGTAYNYSSRSEAEEAAVRKCGSPGCIAYNHFRNSCGALATASNKIFGYSWGTDEYDAKQKALAKCRERSNGEPCKALCWTCTDY